jgi:hypothetical protein
MGDPKRIHYTITYLQCAACAPLHVAADQSAEVHGYRSIHRDRSTAHGRWCVSWARLWVCGARGWLAARAAGHDSQIAR